MRKSELIISVIILLSFVIGIYLYFQMPDSMASHWNAKGQVDGYMSKFWGLFLMPIVLLIMLFLFILIPKIDPLKKNIEKFRKYFDMFIVLITLFMFYIYGLTLLWNLGKTFDMSLAIIPAVGLLFYFIGVMLEKSKRNWFIGIRTPWTLSSDRVWDKTHAIGGKLYKIAGVVAILGLFSPKYYIWFVIVPVISFSLYLLFYSYFAYKKEKR